MRKLLSALAFLIAAAAFLPLTAHAQTRTAQTSPWILTNCNAASLAAPIASCEVRNPTLGIYGVYGFNLLTLTVCYTDAGAGAGTGYSFFLQNCNSGSGSAVCTTDAEWSTVATQSVAAAAISLSPAPVTRSVDASECLTWSISLNYVRLRLATITGLGAPGAGDKITVTAQLAFSPAF